MKIAICGSISFAKEMLDTRKQLEKLGHIVITPEKITKYADKTSAIEDKWDKIEHDVFKTYFEKIKKVDCVLIINKDKNNIKNYIGGNSLIEIAFAHVLNKKIFLLNPIPEMSYSEEIKAMTPIIIENNLNLIKW
jgi:hypothetical protein